ncbi:MAG: hypothetical protein WCT28_00670 [Patescibacteria group bacterium]|jgi:hypothetical protein
MSNSFEKFTAEKPKLSPISREGLKEKICESDYDEKGVDKLLEQLLKEKERFSSIFRTENGSHYFVLHDGSCLRFQPKFPGMDDEDDNTYKLQPIANHIFFVDPLAVKKLKGLMEYPGFALTTGEDSCEIHTAELKQGSVPFEYGFPSVRNVSPVFNFDSTTAKYIGSEEYGRIKPITNPRNPSNYDMGVTHLGHTITQVLWQAKEVNKETLKQDSPTL